MAGQRIEKGPRATGIEGRQENPAGQGGPIDKASQFSTPSISLPKGGGAIRGIGEKFAGNPVTSTDSMTVPSGLLTIYGKDTESRIADPFYSQDIFNWLICETHDDRGKGVIYEYVAENSVNLDRSQANEANRGEADSPLRKTGRYAFSLWRLESR